MVLARFPGAGRAGQSADPWFSPTHRP